MTQELQELHESLAAQVAIIPNLAAESVPAALGQLVETIAAYAFTLSAEEAQKGESHA